MLSIRLTSTTSPSVSRSSAFPSTPSPPLLLASPLTDVVLIKFLKLLATNALFAKRALNVDRCASAALEGACKGMGGGGGAAEERLESG